MLPSAKCYHRVLEQAGQRMIHRLYVSLAVCVDIPAPLLVTHRSTRTHGGQPLALEITHLSADGAQLAYTLTATTQETTGSGTDRS